MKPEKPLPYIHNAVIDTHCHLDYDYDDKTADDLIKEAHSENVSHLMAICTDLKGITAVQAISEKHDHVYHSVGIHPHEARILTDNDWDVLKKASFHQKCKAIGELGIDYYYDHGEKEHQLTCLETQLEFALERKLPIVVHSREGEEDLKIRLEKYAKKATHNPGVIHCFTGTKTFGKACLDLGFYISFSGILTFKNAQDLRDAAKEFPIEKILVETDSPYLAPVPYRGRKCHPRYVKSTLKVLAETKGIDIEFAALTTTKNAKTLFGF